MQTSTQAKGARDNKRRLSTDPCGQTKPDKRPCVPATGESTDAEQLKQFVKDFMDCNMSTDREGVPCIDASNPCGEAARNSLVRRLCYLLLGFMHDFQITSEPEDDLEITVLQSEVLLSAMCECMQEILNDATRWKGHEPGFCSSAALKSVCSAIHDCFGSWLEHREELPNNDVASRLLVEARQFEAAIKDVRATCTCKHKELATFRECCKRELGQIASPNSAPMCTKETIWLGIRKLGLESVLNWTLFEKNGGVAPWFRVRSRSWRRLDSDYLQSKQTAALHAAWPGLFGERDKPLRSELQELLQNQDYKGLQTYLGTLLGPFVAPDTRD